MIASDYPIILAQVFHDRLVWFLSRGDTLMAHGVESTCIGLRWVQLRAGVLSVACFSIGTNLELPRAIARYAPDWRFVTPTELGRLQNFFATVSSGKSDTAIGSQPTASNA